MGASVEPNPHALLHCAGMVRRPFPPTVWVLGWVSLLTDAASEAIYPLLPFFLTTVLGGGPVALGLIEGVAEGTSSLLRIVSGRLSDRTRARQPGSRSGAHRAPVVTRRARHGTTARR